MFQLNDEHILSYSQREVPWGPVGYITYKRTYARPLASVPQRYQDLAELAGVQETEEWWLTVARVTEGVYSWQKKHCQGLHLPWDEEKAQRSATEFYERMFTFKFLPPGRGLWMMGTEYVERNGAAALNNCAFVSTKDISISFADPFCFCADMSMLGVGVGFDTRGAGTFMVQAPRMGGAYRVEDTRGGWVGLIQTCLLAYAGSGSFPDAIDYSQVRAKGTPIRSFGGTSSGPGPLQQLVQDIKTILTPLIGEMITSTAIVDLFNAIGRCVVSGNVRRSAEIALGDPDDEAFLSLKDPDKNGARMSAWGWASNNSVLSPTDYREIADKISHNGEPGIFWLDNARAFGRMCEEPTWDDSAALGTNPCAEQTLEHKELCCLVETFPSKHGSPEDYYRTLKFAYLYAKTVTLIPTHDPSVNAVMLKNRRIGCSQSGITEAVTKFGLKEYLDSYCDKAYLKVSYYDDIYSDWLCVPRSIKLTSVKPSGTVSKLPGVSEGIHYPIAEYYFQVIRFADDSPYLGPLKAAGYLSFNVRQEPNTVAVYFPCKVEYFSRGRSDVSMWEQLELAAKLQALWADNQVSITCTFQHGEAKDIQKALEHYATRLKSVALLPLSTHGYEHAPQQAISEQEYLAALALLKPLNLNLSTSVNETQDKYCDGGICQI